MPRAGDKIAFPTVRKTDPEDVSWALSTAEAMWNRGDHVEAVKWIRRAAEAASECDADPRALELAKVAAELTQQIESGDRPTRVSPPPSTMKTGAPGPPAVPLPSPPAPPVARKVAGSSRPPPPKTGGPSGAKAPALPRVPSSLKHTMPSQQQPRPAEAVEAAPPSRRGSDPRSRRKSHVNLGFPAVEPAVTVEASAPPATPEARRRGRASKPASDEVTGTIVTEKIRNPMLGLESAHSAGGDPDAWPTESVASQPDLDEDGPLERTRVGTQAYQEAALAVSGRNGPATVTPSAAPLRMTQAVRVWVYRTGDGVRVAPAGTLVDAAVVEAVLVSLDPAADLATWFQTTVHSK